MVVAVLRISTVSVFNGTLTRLTNASRRSSYPLQLPRPLCSSTKRRPALVSKSSTHADDYHRYNHSPDIPMATSEEKGVTSKNLAQSPDPGVLAEEKQLREEIDMFKAGIHSALHLLSVVRAMYTQKTPPMPATEKTYPLLGTQQTPPTAETTEKSSAPSNESARWSLAEKSARANFTSD